MFHSIDKANEFRGQFRKGELVEHQEHGSAIIFAIAEPYPFAQHVLTAIGWIRTTELAIDFPVTLQVGDRKIVALGSMMKKVVNEKEK